MLEYEMSVQAVGYFSKKKQYRVVKQEVPFLSRCIDLVLLDKANHIISIEFKVNKWRHAIEQACDHRLGADYAYICLPKRHITDTLLDELKKHSIGLMIYDPQNKALVKKVVQAPGNVDSIPAFRTMLLHNATYLCKADCK